MTLRADVMTLHALAQAVAAELVTWQVFERDTVMDHIAFLRHEPTGAECCLLAMRWLTSARDRIEIKGVYPRHVTGRSGSALTWGAIRYHDKEPGITVSAKRPVRAIAADFRRRFEPQILEVWKIVTERRNRELIENDRADRAIESIRQVSGGRRADVGSDMRVVMHSEDWHGQARMLGSASVELRIDGISPAAAVAAIRAIQRATKDIAA